MRVLLATYWVQPRTGGIHSYLGALRGKLEALGHQVDILAAAPGRTHLRLLDGGEQVERQPIYDPVFSQVARFYRRRLPRTTGVIHNREAGRYAFELSARHFDLMRYDVLHTQDVIATRALHRLRPAGVPLVATIHGGLLTESVLLNVARSRADRQYFALEERLGLTSADLTLVPSRWMERHFSDLYELPPGSLRVVPYGLDVVQFLAAARRTATIPVQGDRPVILCPARLTPIKGADSLLKALALLAKGRRDFTCWLAGTGPMQHRLEREAKRLRLGNHVAFLGDRDDVPALMSAADLIVLPSLHDNLPYAVMEAQATGKAVVASAVGGLPEMIQHGVNGWLVPPDSPAALADALANLLADQSLRLELGAAARAWGRLHWSASRMARETLQAYQEARDARCGD